MIQLKDDLERWYNSPDPWGYVHNPHDIERKNKILKLLEEHAPFDRALDVGAGEGWITKDLPAKKIYGYEISDTAASRFPENIRRYKYRDTDETEFDLVLCTGCFYRQYDYEQLHEMVLDHAKGIILTCHIKSWEIPLPMYDPIYVEEFPYREYTEILKIYDLSTLA